MTESELIIALQERNVKGFKALILTYGDDMEVLAFLLTYSNQRAANIVESILYDIWTTPLVNTLTLPLHQCLFSLVRDACGYPL